MNKVLLSDQEAWSILEPFIPDIHACLVAGWNCWRDLGERVPEHVVRYDSTTRAGIVYNEIIAEARKRFFGVRDVNLQSRGRTLLLIFQGVLVLRFKKIDRNFRTRNVPTKQVVRMQYQMELQGLPPEATQVVAGYLLNALQDSVSGNWIVCPMGRSYEWKLPLGDQQPPPALPIQNPNDPAGPSVRSARVAKEEREAKGG